MWNKKLPAISIGWILLAVLIPGLAVADDEEGCLFCHRLGLVSRAGQETRELRVGGHEGTGHASLYCSDCHPDAKVAPHPARPNPATCVGDCHGVTVAARESHRRASSGPGVEAHRKVSFPRAPCLLCHRGEDKPGDATASDLRCRGCHAGKAADIRNGVHSRVSSVQGANRCAACHPPHRGIGDGRRFSCSGTGCHAQVSPRMIRLAGHELVADSRLSFQIAGRAGTFLAIAFLGWLGGNSISRRKGKGGRSR